LSFETICKNGQLQFTCILDFASSLAQGWLMLTHFNLALVCSCFLG